MSEDGPKNWAIYVDNPRNLVDIVEERDEAGVSGSNWQGGYTSAQAHKALEELLGKGYIRGHETASRF
jgi:hypothetical protein